MFQKWSKEETDQLFDLCEQFDLRFIVIADRFNPPRSIEELKSRYYSGLLFFICYLESCCHFYAIFEWFTQSFLIYLSIYLSIYIYIKA